MEKEIKIKEYFALKSDLERKLDKPKFKWFILMDSICICERYLRDAELESIHQDILKFIIKLYHYNESPTDVVRFGFTYIAKFGYNLSVLKYMLHAYIITKSYDKAQKFLEKCQQDVEILEWIEESLKMIKEKIEEVNKNEDISKEIKRYNERMHLREESQRKAQAEKTARANKVKLATEQAKGIKSRRTNKVEEPVMVIAEKPVQPVVEPTKVDSSEAVSKTPDNIEKSDIKKTDFNVAVVKEFLSSIKDEDFTEMDIKETRNKVKAYFKFNSLFEPENENLKYGLIRIYILLNSKMCDYAEVVYYGRFYLTKFKTDLKITLLMAKALINQEKIEDVKQLLESFPGEPNAELQDLLLIVSRKEESLPEKPIEKAIGDPVFYRQNLNRIFKNFDIQLPKQREVLTKHTPYRSYLVRQKDLKERLESEKQETVIEDVNELLSIDPTVSNRLLQIEMLFLCGKYDKALNRLSRIKTGSGMSANDLNSLKRMTEIIKSVFYDSNANIDENHEVLQEEIRNILIRKEQK